VIAGFEADNTEANLAGHGWGNYAISVGHEAQTHRIRELGSGAFSFAHRRPLILRLHHFESLIFDSRLNKGLAKLNIIEQSLREIGSGGIDVIIATLQGFPRQAQHGH
jgi:hypothetical protein